MKYAFIQRHKRVWPIRVQCRVLNACSETLFGSLKVERLHGQRFETIRQAKDETIAWLLWYNQTRMHSTLHYVSPMQFEKDWMDATVKIVA
jgi:putative transposase